MINDDEYYDDDDYDDGDDNYDGYFCGGSGYN